MGKKFQQQQGIRWGITVREQNIVIGSCGYKNINKKHRRAEIGYERSEEHTSELQSRETISYAVFCLKKKK